MSMTAEKTVRELALENTTATRVFENLGIDYCCGGNKSLEEACRASNISVDQVIDSLEMAEEAAHAAQKDRNWQTEPLAELVAHIRNTHHKYTREEMARLVPLLEKVCSVHGKNHPELQQVRESFQALVQELTTHMMKEERVLFPYIVRMEEAVIQKEPVLPPPFGSVQNPVSMMEHEHDSAGNALRTMRQASCGYTTPGDGVSAIKPCTRPWQTLNPIFTSTFTWRTTFYFRAQLRWKKLTNLSCKGQEENDREK